MSFHTLVSLMISLVLLQGCQSTQSVQMKVADNIYLDDKFPLTQRIETMDEIFYVSPQMREYVITRLNGLPSVKAKSERLIQDLFSKEQLNIHYVHNANFSASETFDKGLANCMSLTMLAYVLVNEADLHAEFLDIEVEENWNVYSNMTLLNGHVNLKVSSKEPRMNNLLMELSKRSYTIDFLPMLNTKIISKKTLTKQQIVALYYNNKGADALEIGNINLAYQYFKSATVLAPNTIAPWSNLASLYRQQGFLSQAENIYINALHSDPDNLNLKENLAILYRVTERVEAADKLTAEVHAKRQQNPYYFAMLAEEELRHDNAHEAVKLFKKAIKLNSQEHLFFFGIAKASLLLKNYQDVEYYLQKAKILSEQPQDQQKYQNKISALATITASIN